MTETVTEPRPAPPPRREPVFRAPWPVTSLIAVLFLAHAARMGLGMAPEGLALSASDLAAGRGSGLIVHQFVHAGWAHLLMNSVFILAFGAPVARFLRVTPFGAVMFWLFFLTCGVVAGGGFAALAVALARIGLASPDWALVGASGAASGLFGATARLMEGRGRIGPLGLLG